MGTAARRMLRPAVGALVVVPVAVVVLLVRNRGPAEGSTTLPEGASSQTLSVGADQRHYRAHRPSELPAQAPLVVVLHGGGGSALHAESSYGWPKLADREGFVVVHPEGLHRTWITEGGCCGRAAAQDVDDVAYLSRVVEDVSRRVELDPDRVFVTGMSNGGMMAYTLACRSDVFAAVAPVAATMLADCTDPSPVSVFHLHGSADTSARLDGEPGEGAADVDGPPVADVIEYWRTTDRCLEPTEVVAGQVRRSVSGCDDGRSVELVVVDGAGHQWPGSDVRRPAADPPFPGLDATEEIWRFFDAHPRPD